MELVKLILERIFKLPKIIIAMLLISFKMSVNEYPDIANELIVFVFSNQRNFNFANELVLNFINAVLFLFFVADPILKILDLEWEKNLDNIAEIKRMIIALFNLCLIAIAFDLFLLILKYPTYNIYEIIEVVFGRVNEKVGFVIFTIIVFSKLILLFVKKSKYKNH